MFSSEIRDHLAWAGGLLASLAAATIAVAIQPERTPFDTALPLLVVTVALLGSFCRSSPLSQLLAAIVGVFPVAALIPGTTLRHLAYGSLFAAALVTATACLQVRGRIPRSAAIVVTLGAVVPYRLFVVVSVTELAVGALITASVIVLLHFMALSRTLRLEAMVLAIAAGFATPLHPTRAALYPLVVALLIAALRARSLVMTAAAVLAALAAGKWALLIVAVTAAIAWFPISKKNARSMVGIGGGTMAVPLSIAPLFRSLAFAPGTFLTVRRSRSGAAAAVLLICALFVRQALTILMALTALALLVSEDEEASPSMPMLAFTILAAVLVPWSGTLPATWPLPLSLIGIGAVTVISMAGSGRSSIPGVLCAAAFLVALFATGPWRSGSDHAVGIALAPGQSVTVDPERESGSFDLLLSGANIAALPRGTSFASLEIIDSVGQAFRRDVTVGEVTDWAALRGDQFFRSRNGTPSRNAGTITGFGSTAFLRSSGAIHLSLTRPVKAISVSADPGLPETGRVQIEAFRFGAW
ncbi:MAG: hypothetical protein ABI718_07405 [Acidobacteriota bacterium]